MRRPGRSLAAFFAGVLAIFALALSMEARAEWWIGATEYVHSNGCGALGPERIDGCHNDPTTYYPTFEAFHGVIDGQMPWEGDWASGMTAACNFTTGWSSNQSGTVRTYQCLRTNHWQATVLATSTFNANKVYSPPPCPGAGEFCWEPPVVEVPDCSIFAGLGTPVCWPIGGTQPTTAMPSLNGYSCSGTLQDVSACVPSAGTCCGSLLLDGGNVLTPPEGEYSADAEGPPVQCISSGGVQHCHHAEQPNCGFVNGERWCAGDLDGISMYSGAVISDDPSAVTDSNGLPVPPDNQFIVEGNTYNYWTANTVSANQAGPTTSNPNQSGSGVPGSGGSGDGGPGSGEGDGEGEGEFTSPDIGEGETMGDAQGRLGDGFDDMWAQWSDQLLPAGGMPQGTTQCPPLAFNAFGDLIETNMHCELIDQHKPFLSMMFLFVYGLISARIVLSA